MTPEQLAAVMLDLQARGCHNINLVTPSHLVPQILEALPPAIDLGLGIPLVYNSGGYDSVDTLRLLEPAVDIFLPDFKFWDQDPSRRFCKAPDYPRVAAGAVKEMYRQKGRLKTDSRGIAVSGLMVRHLVMPGDLAGTSRVMTFLHDEVCPDLHVNVISQYRPLGEAFAHPDLCRPVTAPEFRRVRDTARRLGLTLLD
jgi:putative pyruvate formate lyase activating enzyme